MPFLKNFGFKSEPPGQDGRRPTSPFREYSAEVRDGPMTVVLSPTPPYGRGTLPDGDAR